MLFRSVTMIRNKTRKPARITVPTAGSLDFRSDAITAGLERIADHYQELDVLLANLESKMPQDSAVPNDIQVSAPPATVRKPR